MSNKAYGNVVSVVCVGTAVTLLNMGKIELCVFWSLFPLSISNTLGLVLKTVPSISYTIVGAFWVPMGIILCAEGLAGEPCLAYGIAALIGGLYVNRVGVSVFSRLADP